MDHEAHVVGLDGFQPQVRRQGRAHFRPRALMLALVLALVIGFGLAAAQTPRTSIQLVEIDGPISVATSMQVAATLDRARNEQAALVIVQLDTPGGVVQATREIIRKMLASPVPIVVFVAPSGARAASAGAYITYAAHVTAMAPGTHIGAATPIQLGAPGPQRPAQPEQPRPANQETRSAEERKAINDAAGYLRSLAQLRGRNAEWAEKAVREAAVLSADDAFSAGVVDLKASDLDDLLMKLDGRRVTVMGASRTLVTKGLPVVKSEPDLRMRILGAIADPNVAIILLMIGFYGLLFEFWSPGAIVPGVLGGVCLLLGLTALSVLPLNYGGVALILLGLGLIAAETFQPGLGVLGVGGVIAFLVGAVFLIDPAGADIDLKVAWPVLIGVAITAGLGLSFLLAFAVRARGRLVVTGAEEMIGMEGVVVDWAETRGTVRVHGETWSATGPATVISGQRVRIAARDGLTLAVEPTAE